MLIYTESLNPTLRKKNENENKDWKTAIYKVLLGSLDIFKTKLWSIGNLRELGASFKKYKQE